MRSSLRSLAVSVAALLVLLAAAVPGFGVTYRNTGQVNSQGMPLGGIGAGSVEIIPDGSFGNAEIRNNWGSPFPLTGFVFLLRTQNGSTSTVKLLQSPNCYDLPRVKEIEFSAEFPMARLKYLDPELPLDVSSSAFSTFIPGDARNSALPAFSITYSLHNPGKTPVKAQFVNLLRNYPADTMNALAESDEQTIPLEGKRTFSGVRTGLQAGYFRKATKKARILLISDRPRPQVSCILDEVQNLSYDWAVGNPVKLPANDATNLVLKYDAIWLLEMPKMKQTLGEANMKLIRDAVSQGCGFMISGGPDSFGCAGLHGTPLEEISPVNFADGSDAEIKDVFPNFPNINNPMILSLSWPSFRGFAGYNKVAGIKDQAKVALQTADGDPLVVYGGFNSSPTLAFASSMWGKWHTSWASWNTFMQNLLAYVTRNQYAYGSGVPATDPRYGEFTSGILSGPGETEKPQIQPITLASFLNEFPKNGTLGKDGTGDLQGNWAISRSMTIKPGETRKITFLVAWHFSNHYDEDMNLLGHQYANWFGDSLAVIKYFGDNYNYLSTKTQRWHDVALKGSLGPWANQAALNSLSTLVKSTWWTADGRFGYIESSQERPALNPVDSAYYGSPAGAILFPELDKSFLRQIAANQGESGLPAGYIPRDLGIRALDVPFMNSNGVPRKDLVPQFTLMAYRDYLWTGDLAFLKEMWPHVKQGIAWLAGTDADGNGLPDSQDGDTYFDSMKFAGSSAYVGSLWVAGLQAAARMADVLGDSTAIKDYGEKLGKASKALDGELWNGNYYAASKAPSGAQPDSCLSEQISGQWYSYMLGLGGVVSPDKGGSVVNSILTSCLSPKGLMVSGLPGGQPDKSAPGYSNVINAALNYATISSLLYTEEPLQGRIPTDNAKKLFGAAEPLASYMADVLKTPWNQRKTYSTEGVALQGDHYLGSMAAFMLPMAAMGMRYDAAEKHIAFWPRLGIPEVNNSFAVPGAYGVFSQVNGVEFQLSMADGNLALDALELGNQWVNPTGFAAEINGKPVEVQFGSRGSYVMAVFAKTIHLKAGDKLHITVL